MNWVAFETKYEPNFLKELQPTRFSLYAFETRVEYVEIYLTVKFSREHVGS